MAEMHEEFIERMSEAYDKHYYVEAAWYCYSIFEQRISRLVAKYIDKCKLCPDRTDDKSASISVRITCLKRVIKAKYGPFYLIDEDLMNRIQKWCEERNNLVHSLVSLDLYRKYDKEFEKLAKNGVPLVFELYDACTDLREQWYLMDEPSIPFPVKNCKCSKKKCINANKI